MLDTILIKSGKSRWQNVALKHCECGFKIEVIKWVACYVVCGEDQGLLDVERCVKVNSSSEIKMSIHVVVSGSGRVWEYLH
jgi:hypothetical protein